MKPEGSLSCSQEPSTGPYPEPDQSNLYRSISVGPLSTWHDASSRCGWRRRPPGMEGSCEYIEYAIADSQQGMVLQLESWAWTNNSSP
jgi:hypothetical protein